MTCEIETMELLLTVDTCAVLAIHELPVGSLAGMDRQCLHFAREIHF